MVGFLLLLTNNNSQANFAGLFLAAAGVYPLIPVVVSWGANNSGGSLRKGTAAAIIVSFGNVSFAFPHLTYPSDPSSTSSLALPLHS
jgi:hypothetical protein